MEIPTEPIGSIPRPRQLIDALRDTITRYIPASQLGTAMAERAL